MIVITTDNKSKIKSICSVSFLYALTLLLLWSFIKPHAEKFFVSPPTTFAIATQPKPRISKSFHFYSGTPQTLHIESLGMTKDIQEGIYNQAENTWNVSDSGIHFANLSQKANNSSGATLIYGHNNQYTFGTLQSLKLGDNAVITTANNLRFTYVFESASDNEPTNTDIFSYREKPILVLQTCVGAFNESRRFYTFNLINVERVI